MSEPASHFKPFILRVFDVFRGLSTFWKSVCPTGSPTAFSKVNNSRWRSNSMTKIGV